MDCKTLDLFWVRSEASGRWERKFGDQTYHFKRITPAAVLRTECKVTRLGAGRQVSSLNRGVW